MSLSQNLEKQEEINSKQKEEHNIQSEIYEIRKNTEKINKAKGWFFEKINIIDKSLT